VTITAIVFYKIVFTTQICYVIHKHQQPYGHKYIKMVYKLQTYARCDV